MAVLDGAQGLKGEILGREGEGKEGDTVLCRLIPKYSMHGADEHTRRCASAELQRRPGWARFLSTWGKPIFLSFF